MKIVRTPGLRGTVRLWFDAGAVHLDHEALHNPVIRLLSGHLLVITVRRPALAAAAQGLSRSRYQPARV